MTRRRRGVLFVKATGAARLTIWCFGIYAIWQGTGIYAGGASRWGGPSFSVLRSVDHATVVWGISLVAFGTITLIGSLTMNIIIKGVGLFGITVWSLCLAGGAFGAAQGSTLIPTTGGPTYTVVAAVCVILMFIDESHLRLREEAPDAP